MFEKLPTARMNNGENCSTGQLIVSARELRGEHTAHPTSSHFPSYLRLIGNFFGQLISESYGEATRLSAGCCGRFRMPQANVAFL
jgi:hypothetical protein